MNSFNSGTVLEDAVMSAGIDQQIRGTSGQASVVSDRHHYPSPFSQVKLNFRKISKNSKNLKVPVEERPHSCTFCYKRFARADECKRHERIHTDTRPFSKFNIHFYQKLLMLLSRNFTFRKRRNSLFY